MKGKIIVFEGLDCSGKTTIIAELLKLNSRYVYSKGIGADNRFGKFTKKFPSTFLFYFELLLNSYTTITPNLKKNKLILQDRYDISIRSFFPLTSRFYNKLIIKLFTKIIKKPDAIIYLSIPLDERIKRLKEKGTYYELMLANDPRLIKIRENIYQNWFNGFKGSKIKINTKDDINITLNLIQEFIKTI